MGLHGSIRHRFGVEDGNDLTQRPDRAGEKVPTIRRSRAAT